MKHSFPFFTKLLLMALVVFASCKKEEVIIRPGNLPYKPALSHKVQFKLEALPGTTDVAIEHFAVINVVDEQDQPVLLNHKLALQHDGHYYSDTLTLTGGNFKITKFLIVDKANLTRYAVPFASAELGRNVQKPLAINLALPQQSLTVVPIDVLKINTGDDPQKFGYPVGSFNVPNSDNPDYEIPDPNPFLKIKLLPLIKIGDVVYDSVPVAFTLTSWDAASVPKVVNMNLSAGTNEISLPKAAVKYDLRVTKWGTVDEMSLQKKDVQEGTVYTIGGSRAAKKLQSVITFDFEQGAYVAKTRNVFQYDGGGKLHKILYYKKRNNVPYIDQTELFTYNALGLIQKIEKMGENNQTISETSFSYNAIGKVVSMLQKQGSTQTSAQVNYAARPGKTGITGNYNINIQYNNNGIASQYNMQFTGGNKVEELHTYADGKQDAARLQYDFNINPFIHLGLPDLFLTHASKHNMGSQQRGYESNNPPNQYAAATAYTYDADGYPKEAISQYMHPFLGIYMGKTKTVYNY